MPREGAIRERVAGMPGNGEDGRATTLWLQWHDRTLARADDGNTTRRWHREQLVDHRRESGRCGVFEQAPQRYAVSRFRAQQRDESRGAQGVTTKIEEVVEQANIAATEDLAKAGYDHRLCHGTRRGRLRASRRGHIGNGERPSIELAVRRE